MDLSAKMLQWLTQQGFHAVRAGNTALFPRLKSYLVAVGPGKTETKRTGRETDTSGGCFRRS